MKCTICKQFISFNHYYIGASLICEIHSTMFNNLLENDQMICKKCFQSASEKHTQDYDLSLDIS